jgi:hypothetical protein
MIDRSALAEAFAAWIVAPRHDDVVPVPPFEDETGATVDALPAATVAYELSDFSRPVPDEVGVALRLPASATYAHAARLLWCLREDESLHTPTYEATLRTLQALSPEQFRTYYKVVDEAVDAVTTTLPVWPGGEQTGSPAA